MLADHPEAVGNASLKSNACLQCRASPDLLSSNDHPAAPARTMLHMKAVYEAIQEAQTGIAQLSEEPVGETHSARQERMQGLRQLRNLIKGGSEDAQLSCKDGTIPCSLVVSCNIDVYNLSPSVERVGSCLIFSFLDAQFFTKSCTYLRLQMHTLDLGLLKYFLGIVLERTHAHGLVDTLNHRLQESTSGVFRAPNLQRIPELKHEMVRLTVTVQQEAFCYYQLFIYVLQVYLHCT